MTNELTITLSQLEKLIKQYLEELPDTSPIAAKPRNTLNSFKRFLFKEDTEYATQMSAFQEQEAKYLKAKEELNRYLSTQQKRMGS